MPGERVRPGRGDADTDTMLVGHRGEQSWDWALGWWWGITPSLPATQGQKDLQRCPWSLGVRGDVSPPKLPTPFPSEALWEGSEHQPL